MTDMPEPPETEDGESGAPAWDAVEVMRARAEATRQDRDNAIAELRRDMSEEEILDEFGIDLSQLEE